MESPELSFEVVKPGVETTVQDYPGRVGYWGVGICPSGPLDDYSFRLANRLVGNSPGSAGLEVAAGLLVVRMKSSAIVAICGAEMQQRVNDRPVPRWESFAV